MDLATTYYHVINPKTPRFSLRKPVYAAAGIFAFSRASPIPTDNTQIKVLMVREYRQSETPTLSFPGGKIDGAPSSFN